MKRLLILLPFAFLAIFFFYPLATITARGLAPMGVIDLSAFGRIVGSTFYRETLWFTVWQAAVSTVLTVLAAFPAAYVMARYDFRGKSLISALTLVPFVMPTVIVAATAVVHSAPSSQSSARRRVPRHATLSATTTFRRTPSTRRVLA